MNITLTYKNAFVCGSTQGIGKAIAEQLALSGANVTLIARDEEALGKVKDELHNSGSQEHSYIVADFSDPDGLKDSISAHVAGGSPVHILVNNTGGPKGGEIAAAETEEFENAFRMHLICNHILVQALMEGMKSEGYGRIINIISTSVKQPIHGLGVSNTIRGAVASWSKTLANELGRFGITVNNILPGATDTARLTSIIENKSNKLEKSIAEVERDMKMEIPARRFASPDEIAYAAVFLASPEAGYINGVSLPVDGGRLSCL